MDRRSGVRGVRGRGQEIGDGGTLAEEQWSGDTEGQCAGAADLADGPGDGGGVGQAELGDAGEPDLEGDAQFHPRQVRAQAAVDAEAEGGVPVDLAVDQHLVGPVELRGVAVGGREREQDPVLGLHVDAAEVHVFLHQPGHRDRGVGPEELLHGGRQRVGRGEQALAVGRMAGQVPQRGADRAPGGVDAGDQQQHDRADDVVWAELLAVQLGVDEVGREVIAGVVHVVADLVVEVVEQGAEPFAAIFRRQVNGSEHVLDELREQGRLLY